MIGRMGLVPGDPLAHRALEWLLHAETSVRGRLVAELGRAGLSASGFTVLVVLSTAGGELELRALRSRLRTSKANASEVVTTLEQRGLVDAPPAAARPPQRGRAPDGAGPGRGRPPVPRPHRRVQEAFAVLDEDEKRSLARLCRKLAA